MRKHALPIRSPGIRIQLTLLYTAIFALLILLFCLILYSTLQAFLASGVDSALRLRAQQIAGGISSENGKFVIQDVTGELPGLDSPASTDLHGTITDVNFGVLVRMLDTQGRTVYISPAFHALSLPPASFTQPLHDVPWQSTVTASNGQAIRIYSVALTDDGSIFGVLQVGESLAQLTATLQSVTIALLLITPFVLLLSAFGSYWLAKRAFRPILRLTRTAREIKAGDLDRRVPVPHTRDDVYDLALTLNEMIERLEQAFRQQRRFVADASHELRTPVTAIRSITEVALEDSLSLDEFHEILSEIKSESERLGLLISDLLVLARADEDQMPLDHEPVRLDLLACDVVATMEPLANERGVPLQLQTLEPATVIGDTARLIQVLMGLVDNALTYTNAGGAVTLSVETHDDVVCLTLRDTGIGIDEEDKAHVFERFYRADPARSRAAGGSGLGLSIAQWVIQAHGGTINVESQLGQGSTFTVTLPLAAPTPLSLGREEGIPSQSIPNEY